MYTINELITSEKFIIYTNYINKKREEGHTWEEIKYALKGTEAGLLDFLKKYGEDFILIDLEDWYSLVNKMEEIDTNSFPVSIGKKHELLQVPTLQSSCWINYKNKLISSFSASSIVDIENTTIDIISRLSDATIKEDPVRGMVFGNVQSGKTANMAALISMAADYNYNFFIILTGTIENLRRQTMERLLKDLNSGTSTYTYQSLERLSATTKTPDRLQDLNLGEKHNKYYITVCLKNSTRLKNLLSWLNKDLNQKGKLKILLIDDEADQAGINTANISKGLQSTISKYIKNIVFARDKDSNDSAPYRAMNYIGYTATPYGNFLNEASEDSIYPKDFIVSLNAPVEYMGPEQYFGIEGEIEGLPLIRKIEDKEIKYFNEGFGNTFSVEKFPQSLKDAISWFICSISLFRYWKLSKPVSMLVHTSQLVSKHFIMKEQIEIYLKSLFSRNDWLEELKCVYNKEKEVLDSELYIDLMGGYNSDRIVKELPCFEVLEPYLRIIKEKGTQNIVFDREEEKLTYGLGIHLCVDNCFKNETDVENVVLRLVYPDPNDKKVLETCPAFLVIGGQTLSRGLTLEGLTTSYFLRTTSTADTLMQMGRWFGYRIGYELSPRVWLSSNAVKMFEHLTVLDHELRNELKRMDDQNILPSEYGPRIKYFPDFNCFKVTSKGKMQKAVCDITYANKTGQIIKYYSDEKIFKNNYELTVDFINSLGKIDEDRILKLENRVKDINNIPRIWFDVSHEKVIGYLSKLKYPYQKAIYDVEKFEEWYENQFDEGYLKEWTIMLATIKKSSQTKQLDLKYVSINLPKRKKSTSKSTSEIINIMALTNQTDKLADIDYSKLSSLEKEEFDLLIKKTKDNNDTPSKIDVLNRIDSIRMKYASKCNPLLIVYIIDKDENGIEESSLRLKDHLVGYYIYVPEGIHENKYGNSNTISVELEFDNESDVIEDA